MGLLKGNALDTATAVRENQPRLNVSFADFESEMKKVFDHPGSFYSGSAPTAQLNTPLSLGIFTQS